MFLIVTEAPKAPETEDDTTTDNAATDTGTETEDDTSETDSTTDDTATDDSASGADDSATDDTATDDAATDDTASADSSGEVPTESSLSNSLFTDNEILLKNFIKLNTGVKNALKTLSNMQSTGDVQNDNNIADGKETLMTISKQIEMVLGKITNIDPKRLGEIYTTLKEKAKEILTVLEQLIDNGSKGS